MSSSDTGMVEKVARAICCASGHSWKEPPYNNLHSDAVNNHWRFKARAALEALHEPTPEMVVAMEEAFFDSTMGTPLHGSSEDAAAMFKAAIDAALSHKEGEGR